VGYHRFKPTPLGACGKRTGLLPYAGVTPSIRATESITRLIRQIPLMENAECEFYCKTSEAELKRLIERCDIGYGPHRV
jgi:hypothetical protein